MGTENEVAYSIEDYLSVEKHYCREERQYALFLYNIFLNCKLRKDENVPDMINKLLGEESGKISIDEVFYEAALMRDYHYNTNRREFNSRLINFCMYKFEKDNETKYKSIMKKAELLSSDSVSSDSVSEDNLGAKKATQWIYEGNEKYGDDEGVVKNVKRRMILAKCMMNAKPDILVIYRKDGKRRACALECKYESGNGKYKDLENRQTIHQELVQGCIMNFLFGKNCNPLDKEIESYYPYSRNNSLRDNWKTDYSFIKDILYDYNTPLFSDITNMGVKHIDFEKGVIKAHDLINTGYGAKQ